MKKIIIISLAILLALLCIGCSTSQVTPSTERILRDTLYRYQVQVDSIYIQRDHSQEYHRAIYPGDSIMDKNSCISRPDIPDTLYIKDASTEYRYRLLHDTLRIHQIDSIPVVHTVKVVETKRYMPWYAKCSLFIVITCIILFIIYIIWKIKF